MYYVAFASHTYVGIRYSIYNVDTVFHLGCQLVMACVRLVTLPVDEGRTVRDNLEYLPRVHSEIEFRYDEKKDQYKCNNMTIQKASSCRRYDGVWIRHGQFYWSVLCVKFSARTIIIQPRIP